jgi:hypothetical protein
MRRRHVDVQPGRISTIAPKILAKDAARLRASRHSEKANTVK